MGAQDKGLSLEGLAQRLETLERENARISSENAELWHKVATLEGSDTRRDGEEPALEFSESSETGGPVSRRLLLTKAGAAAVAAVAAGTLLNPRAAKADHFNNAYFAATFIRTHALEAIHDSRPAVAATTYIDHNGAVEGTNIAQFGVGVSGDSKGSDGTGVRGWGNKYGVVGFARGTNGNGVRGVGDTGVWGSTRRIGWSGVYGEHTGRFGYGVVGDGTGSSGAGVLGRNSSGYGGQFEGGKAQLRLLPGDSAGPPTGVHSKGELYMDQGATLWVCVRGGPDSGWRKFTTTA